ncbi:MAG: hypothetical protein JW759_06240 [Candidatus Coatesbacteria bacterium]|nr:hypothetical protein [Candidatus Coatesbacteria bacterium]
MRTLQSSDRATSQAFLILPHIALLIGAILYAGILVQGCKQTVQIRYQFNEAKPLHYALRAEASLGPDIAFNARGETIWRCLKREPGGFDLEITLRDLVLTGTQTPIREETSSETQATIRFKMSGLGDISVTDQEARDYDACPARMVIEALLDAVPRLPASPIGENDSWTAQSREVATQFPELEGGAMLVRYECVVEEVPIRFGGVVLSLSSSFESESHADESDTRAWEPPISGHGKGRIVLSPQDGKIRSLVHETWATVVRPQVQGGAKESVSRTTHRMKIALDLIEQPDMVE